MKRTLTAEQTAAKDARRARFKALWKQVAAMPEAARLEACAKLGIVTCEGSGLSIRNQILIALQLPGATVVGGFRQWLKHGRAVQKGQHGAMIWVPCGGRSNDVPLDGTAGGVACVADGAPEGDNDRRFLVGTVFDLSQTKEIEESEAA